MLLLNLLIFLASIGLLILSGSILVKSLTKLASFLKVSQFALSFILMALATSLPELGVGIVSAINKIPNLALGTVIGSNIADLTIVIGVAVLLSKRIKVEPQSVRTDSFIMFFISLLPIVLFLLGNGLSRIDGAILVLVFIAYSYWIIKEREKFRKQTKNRIKRYESILHTVLFIFGVGLLYLSSELVVKYGKLISLDLGLKEIMIGLFLVAFGTSLPEIVFEVSSAIKGYSDMALGNIMGSVVCNSTLVLGVASLIFPITANFLLFLTSAIFMVIITFLFVAFVNSGKELTWLEGLSLLMLYGFFIMVEFHINPLG